MANFKRRYPRTRSKHAIRGSSASWRAKHGLKPVRVSRGHYPTLDEWLAVWRKRNRHKSINGYMSPMNSYPAWWDRVFHTRPARAKNRAILRAVFLGHRDPDNTVWRDGRKPHKYYW